MKSLLIVEDEKLIRQGISTMVKRCGVPVETIIECSNGEQALDALKEQDIDVMFTDIRMPKMDGIRLVQEVNKLEKKPFVVANIQVSPTKTEIRKFKSLDSFQNRKSSTLRASSVFLLGF